MAFPYRITASAVKALVEIHAFAGVFKVPSLAIINEPLVLTLRGKINTSFYLWYIEIETYS